jgi:phage terminase large subunit-like protein
MIDFGWVAMEANRRAMQHTPEDEIEIYRLAQAARIDVIAREEARRRCQFRTIFPESGKLRRELYKKHVQFFQCGSVFKERLFMAANRVGKTVAGAYETACHLTGIYPWWWEGHKFSKAPDAWACGVNSQTTRGVVQAVLLGRSNDGMIPGDLVMHTTAGRGLADSIETVWVKHKSGGSARLTFKSYEQGRRAFEGEAKDFVWCDEEPPLDIYVEMLYRLLTTKGIAYTTFTPLLGMSDMVRRFLEDESDDAEKTRVVIQAGWGDVPHLDEKEKSDLAKNTPPYQVRARTEGEPALGAGAVYPFDETAIAVDPFPIPEFWPRAYGLDVGWERTACIWGARDPGTGVVYLYHEYYEHKGPDNAPANHALAIQAQGKWIHGVVDPASAYHQLQAFPAIGLNLVHADNNVEAGIMTVFERLACGQLRVFRTCQNWFREFRQYHRDAKGSGKIVKVNDHLMDATRYLCVSGIQCMRIRPRPQQPTMGHRSGGWIGN